MAEENRCPQCGEKLAANAPGGVCPKCLIKLGLPSGADVEKTTTPDDKSGVPTSATPPGRFVPPEPAELAKQFPQLEILALLGQGGMGAVYKARQKQLDRLVALKILPPEVGQDPAFAERFTREARSMAKLSHQHVVTLHEFGQTEEGLYYFIMEFVDGTDLRHVIQSGELSPDEALVIVPKICEALHYAHKKGIVHRDIKPENILLDKEGNIKIADFGLARLLDRPGTAFTLTQAGQRMGTPHYMAPEQIEGAHEVDHRADIYSLGVVFYEMLTGQLPIGQFAPPSQKVQVDVRLDKVVLKSLAHEPERRYQQASEVKTDVETIAGQERVIARPLEHPGEEAIRKQVKLPAIGLLVTGIINWIGITAGVLFMAKSQAAQNNLIPEAALWLVAAIAIVFSGLIFFAALKMMRLEAYAWAVAGSIVAMITTPGNIIGLPIGVWALVVLSSGEVKGAFARKKMVAESKTGKPEGKPGQRRFSRTAIVGACLSALALFWIPAALIYVGEIHPSDLQEFIMWLCILIGCTPVFATTILGMVSITQIRHSAGRLYGMGLALFDVLLFPVLVLDIAIAVVFILAGLGVAEAVILMLIICGMLDFFLIRWAWRKANAGLVPAQIPTGEIPQPGTVFPTQPTEKPDQPERQASEIKPDAEKISAESKPTEVVAEKSPTARKFSRAAIIGSCWASLFLPLLIPVLMHISVSQATSTTGDVTPDVTPKVGIGLLALIILVPFLILGLSALFGTTILGLISVSQIRNSSGRLYGMGLAVFDALLFPLLLLNAVIVLITASNIVQSPLGSNGQYALLIAVLSCPVLDLFIIRWAWRKANAGLEPIQGDRIAGTP